MRDNPSSHLLRRGRLSEPGRFYLLTAVTHERHPFFADMQSARALTNILRDLHQTERVVSLAFVIMPDHLHWLVKLGSAGTLGKLMQAAKGRTARYLNAAASRTPGRVWQPGYHDHALRKDEEVRAVARYIVANPLRAGLVERIEDYPFWDAIWL